MKKWLFLSGLLALSLACTFPRRSAPPAPTAAPPGTDTLPPPSAPPAADTAAPPPAAALSTQTPVPALTAAPPETPASAPGLPLPALSAGAPLTITRIWMADAASGWGLGYQEPGETHVLRTGDGGATWTDASPPAGAFPLTRPAALFRDAQTAWVAYPAGMGQAASVWLTADGGDSWREIPLPVDAGAEEFSPAFFAADGDSGWLLATVGAGMQHAYSDLYATEDGGQTWSLVATPSSEAASPLMGLPHTGMAFRGFTGWVTKENGVMDGVAFVSTADGGVTWTAPAFPAPDADAMCSTYAPALFTPRRGAYLTVCRDYQNDTRQAFFSRLEDGRVTYTPLPAAADSLVFFNPRQGLALGCPDWDAPDPLQCPILSTRDGGQTWTLVDTVYWDGEFFFLDALNGWAAARNGAQRALVRTADGGVTWQLLAPVAAGR